MRSGTRLSGSLPDDLTSPRQITEESCRLNNPGSKPPAGASQGIGPPPLLPTCTGRPKPLRPPCQTCQTRENGRDTERHGGARLDLGLGWLLPTAHDLAIGINENGVDNGI